MHTPFVYKPIAVAIAAVFLSSVTSLNVQAQPNKQQESVTLINLNVAAGSLTQELNQLAQAAGEALSYTPALVKGKTTQGIQGRYSLDQALEKILLNTGLTAVKHGSAGGYVIKN